VSSDTHKSNECQSDTQLLSLLDAAVCLSVEQYHDFKKYTEEENK